MTARQFPLSVWSMLDPDGADSSFALPGTEELMSFAGLWDNESLTESSDPGSASETTRSFSDVPVPEIKNPGGPDGRDGIPFHTPGLLPGEAKDPVTLVCPLPPAAKDDHFLLTVPPLLGKGTLSLNDTRLFSFCSFPGFRTDEPVSAGIPLDLTDQLAPDRDNVLQLCFEPYRPAGICGLFSLRVYTDGRIDLVSAARARLRAQCTFGITVCKAGQFTLRITSLPDNALIEQPTLSFAGPAQQTVDWSIPIMSASPVHYRISLLSDTGALCDSLTVPVGKSPRPGDAFLPLPPEDSVLYPEDLISLLRRFGSPSVYTTVPLSEDCISALSAADIPLCLPKPMQSAFPAALSVNPGVCFIDPPPMLSVGAASAWQFCGLLTRPRPLPQDCPPEDLLQEIFGYNYKSVPGLPARLAEIHLLHVRLHAELVRQGLGHGSLCAVGEWDDAKITDILSAVYRPCHLSIAPVQGAWFAGSELIFSSRVFLEESDLSEADAALQVEFCLLESADPSLGGPFKLLYKDLMPADRLIRTNLSSHVKLPDHAACLLLCGRLISSKTIKDTVIVPVFVGLKAILEAALTLNNPPYRLDFNLFG